MSVKKSYLVSGLVIAVLSIILGVVTAYARQEKPYSVVYLSSGEVYVGKLSTFPKMILEDGLILQVVQKEGEGGSIVGADFNLAPLEDAIWAPEKLYLNRDQVYFHGVIKETSKMFETLREYRR